MKQFVIDFFSKDLFLLQDYINGYTILSLIVFYVLGFLWKRFYPIGFFQNLFYSLWFFVLMPGTIAHEFMHFFMGVFFKAKPTGFSLLPKKTEDGYVLGSVSFSNISFLNAFPVSMSPILLLPLSLYFLIFFHDFFTIDKIHLFYAGYFVYNLWVSSVPSITDFRLLFRYPLGIVFYGIIIFAFMKINENGGF